MAFGEAADGDGSPAQQKEQKQQKEEECCVRVAVHIRPLVTAEIQEGCADVMHVEPDRPTVIRMAELTWGRGCLMPVCDGLCLHATPKHFNNRTTKCVSQWMEERMEVDGRHACPVRAEKHAIAAGALPSNSLLSCG
jgi:hypothetical protein